MHGWFSSIQYSNGEWCYSLIIVRITSNSIYCPCSNWYRRPRRNSVFVTILVNPLINPCDGPRTVLVVFCESWVSAYSEHCETVILHSIKSSVLLRRCKHRPQCISSRNYRTKCSLISFWICERSIYSDT